MTVTSTLVAVFILFLFRAGYVYWSHRTRSRPPRATSRTCHISVFLGSGGHTTEALQLLAGLDRSRYTLRTLIVSAGDILSVQRALSFGVEPAQVHEIPRARLVHQPLATVPRTFLVSFLHTFKLVIPGGSQSPLGDVLLMNGPGTCVVLCVCVWIARFLGWTTPRMVYVESFARVTSLSLSGKILAPLVDKFVVQWPELASKSRFAENRGWLV